MANIPNTANNSSLSKKRPNQRVRDSSKQAFADKKKTKGYVTEYGFTCQMLREIQPASRRMISKATELPINHITKYVDLMIKKGFAHELPVKQPCQISGIKVYYLECLESEGKKEMIRHKKNAVLTNCPT